MIDLEKNDIQGLVFGGYPKNPSARYLVFEIADAVGARAWLHRFVEGLTTGESRTYGVTTNLALTARGILALGLPESALATFSREFREGMSSEDHRSRILGDTGESAPGLWHWGGPEQAPVHLLLMAYAPDDDSLERCLAKHRADYGAALKPTFIRDTVTLPERREHFGFADGIAQPAIEGSSRAASGAIPAGEFVLGYANAYGKIPVSPSVPASLDAGRHLLPVADQNSDRDLGRNGTYLVVRQLEQDVEAFWQAMTEYAEGPSGTFDRDAATRLAAKCVGRWPSGAPLVAAPERDDPARAKDNAFLYALNDPHGLACPIGSHIRRTNPRDSLEPGPEESLRVVNRHRILRRGRSYGPRLEPFAREARRAERGLFFMCINANIRRQFEFIQQTWSNNPKFSGLVDDKDPIIGDQPTDGGIFTIPEEPVRRRLGQLARFVQVRGGEYFFLPSARALRFLAALQTPGAVAPVAAKRSRAPAPVG